jgi:hypothetical protein
MRGRQVVCQQDTVMFLGKRFKVLVLDHFCIVIVFKDEDDHSVKELARDNRGGGVLLGSQDKNPLDRKQAENQKELHEVCLWDEWIKSEQKADPFYMYLNSGVTAKSGVELVSSVDPH